MLTCSGEPLSRRGRTKLSIFKPKGARTRKRRGIGVYTYACDMLAIWRVSRRVRPEVLYFAYLRPRAIREDLEDPAGRARGAAPNRTIPMSLGMRLTDFRHFLIFRLKPEKRDAIACRSASMNGPARARSLNPHPHSDVRRRPRPTADGHRRRVVCSCLSRVTTRAWSQGLSAGPSGTGSCHGCH